MRIAVRLLISVPDSMFGIKMGICYLMRQPRGGICLQTALKFTHALHATRKAHYVREWNEVLM